MSASLSRRRFISITGLAGVACALPLSVLASQKETPLYHWRGFALGADASIKLYSDDKEAARTLTKACLEEVLRLEKLFSLYEPDSVINKLNKEGKLENPPEEFRHLVREAIRYSDLTSGAFDISVQPLWQAYAEDGDIKAAAGLVDYKRIKIKPDAIEFTAPGMAITLNGIAQGYITDKITELLKKSGIDQVLVNMGETRALGTHPDGMPWQIGIRNPENPEAILETTELVDKAIATSGGYGTSLGQDHHLFDPRTGKSAHHHQSVSIIAPTATAADALSTGLYSMPYEQAASVLSNMQEIRAIFM